MRIVGSVLLSLILVFGVSAEAFAAGGGGAGGGVGSASGPDPSKAYKAGVELLLAGDCKKAARKFRSVLKDVPRNAEAHYLRGRALACDDQFKRAASSFKKAIKYDRELYAAYSYLGIAYLALEKTEDAEDQLSVLREMKSECEDACPPKLEEAYRSLSEEIQGESAGAPRSFLLESASEPRTAYLEAVEQINAGDFLAAIEELRSLLERIGPVPDVLNYLGYAHRKLMRFDESLAYYEQALTIDPDHLGANEYLGELFVELGRVDRAEEQLAILSRLCPFGCAEFEDLKRRIESRALASR